MAKISRETAIEHLADIAKHYLVSYEEVEAWRIEDYGGNNVKRDLKDLGATCNRDLKRIKYLKSVISSSVTPEIVGDSALADMRPTQCPLTDNERTNNHDTAEPAEPTEPTAGAASTAAAAAADAAARAAIAAATADAIAYLIQRDGTGEA